MPPTEPLTSRTPRRRWQMAFLLAVGVVVNYFDRINLSVSQGALHDSFGLSLITFGYLSSAFSWTYALMQIPSGVLLDRFGVRRVGRIGTLAWSVASFGASVSPSLAGMFAARLLLGAAESPTFPGNAKAIGYWFPKSERSTATAIADAAAKFAPAIGVPFIGLLVVHFGWRWSFATTGFISFLYFLLFYFVYRNPTEDAKLTARERQYITDGGAQPEDKAKAKGGTSLWYLLRQRKVYGLFLGWGAYNYSFFLLLTWLPSYLSISMGLDLQHSAFYTSIPWLFGTLTDFVIGGWLVDRLINRGWNANRVRLTVLIAGTALGLGILGAARAHSTTTALIWISISVGGLAAAAPVAWTIPSLIAPRESVGTLGGIVNLGGQLAGITAPIVTGYIVAATHSFASAFVTATIILLLGISGYVFLLGNIEPIPEPLPRA